MSDPELPAGDALEKYSQALASGDVKKPPVEMFVAVDYDPNTRKVTESGLWKDDPEQKIKVMSVMSPGHETEARVVGIETYHRNTVAIKFQVDGVDLPFGVHIPLLGKLYKDFEQAKVGSKIVLKNNDDGPGLESIRVIEDETEKNKEKPSFRKFLKSLIRK